MTSGGSSFGGRWGVGEGEGIPNPGLSSLLFSPSLGWLVRGWVKMACNELKPTIKVYRRKQK